MLLFMFVCHVKFENLSTEEKKYGFKHIEICVNIFEIWPFLNDKKNEKVLYNLILLYIGFNSYFILCEKEGHCLIWEK